jgi:ATP-dependent DNA helicase RecG
MDDLPKGFELSEGQVQAETPTLPARVLREAIVNALMHRSYREHQPTQVIRYSNRIEIRNAGFSLKNEDSLGQPGSELRNPNLAAIFHETNTAETKGSGIRTMRRLMEENGFSLPTFESNRAENFFVSRLLLHHFLSEQDLLWLKQTPQDLTDGQKIALIFVREQGAVDNQTLRQLTGGEVLAVSQELRRLRDIHLLESKGKGSATYYVPGAGFPAAKQADQPAGHGTLGASHGTLSAGHGTLGASHGTLADSLPDGLRSKLEALGKRPGEKIRPMILELCAWRALTAAELAELFGRSDSKALKRDHLGPMIVDRELEYTHPDMERHPKQAYRITNTKPAP